MFIGADELVTSGGPTGPAWAFFTAMSLALVGVLAQQLKARSDLKQLKATSERVEDEAIKAHESAAQAQENTTNVSNGFVGRMDRKFDRLFDAVQEIRRSQTETEKALREHIEWHLEKEK